MYWKQRAKTFLLAEGDENTKFFHANASARRITNRIAYMMNDSGVRVEDQDAICDVMKNYFEGDFCGASVDNTGRQIDVVSCVSVEQNASLVADLSFEEFSLAVNIYILIKP